MADTIADGTTTITLSNGFKLNVGWTPNEYGIVKVPYSDVNFIRDMGAQVQTITASGVETFATAAEATTFVGKFELIKGNVSTITHDSLDGSSDAILVSFSGTPDSNAYPGFHVVWEAQFLVPSVVP